MKYRNKIIWALLLAGVLLLSAVGCKTVAEETAAEPEQTASIETEAPVEETYFTLSSSVYVVRPTGDLSDDMLTAIKLFTSAGKSLVDGGITVTEDWYRDELVRHEFEILIGNTNRPESGEAFDTLAYYDYMYEVISPNTVLICGGSDSATLKAVQKFLGDCYGYRAGQKGELRDISVGSSYVYRQQYSLSLSLCGQPIDSYVIVHKDSTLHQTAAKALAVNLSKATGIKLPTVTAASYTGGNAILLGMADTDGSHLYRDYGSYSFAMSCEEKNGDVRVMADSTANIRLVAQAVSDTLLAGLPREGAYDIELAASPRIYCACTDAMYSLALQQVREEEMLTDGLQYHERVYADRDGKPVIAYVLEVDLSKVDVLNATPDYGDAILNVKATTPQAMRAAAQAGYQVWAGMNADFFRINSDYSPQGLCIKQGKVLSGTNSRPWFGITKDGKAVMGEASDYAKYAGQLQEAVGGSNVLLRNGLVENVAYLADSKSDRHPRTVVGVRADGTLLIIAVDGRQEKLSNGATMSDMAGILLELGAVDAVNLDGGGSTTVVTTDGGEKYSIRNSPSDGSLRPVYNSLIVVSKQ